EHLPAQDRKLYETSESGLFSRTHQRRKAPHTLASPDRRFCGNLAIDRHCVADATDHCGFPLGRLKG
ncbi:MAG: hypothetical protein WCD82_06405, partial [Xanthobacteraceae bacterium]